MNPGIAVISILMLMSCVAKNQPVTHYTATDYFILMEDILHLELDHLGNIYIVDDTDRLSKFDSTGQLLFTIVNNNLGHIHSIDVGNPFKIMLFYRDQQTVQLNDRTLSEIQRIRLSEWNFQDVTAACLSPDNAIWLFDGTKKVLVKMDHAGKPILTSDPFDIIRPPLQRPDFIYDTDNFLVLKERGQPMAVFNDFGNYLNPLPFNAEMISVSNNRLIRHEGSSVRIHGLPGGEEISSIALKEVWSNSKVRAYGQHIYITDEKGVFIQRIPDVSGK